MLSGKMALPDRDTRQQEIAAHRERQRKTYLDSPRYTLEVDYALYSKQMKNDITTGTAGT